MIVALALTAVGVTRKAVIADYAATAERMDAIVGRLRASKTYGGDVDSIPPADRMPWPETMAAFLDQIDARYGGLPQWLSDHGFSQADLASLGPNCSNPRKSPPWGLPAWAESDKTQRPADKKEAY